MALFEWLKFEERGGRTALGKMLRRFDGRILANIRLRVHDQDKRRPKFSFERVEEPGAGVRHNLIHNVLGVPQGHGQPGWPGNIVVIVEVHELAMASIKISGTVIQGVDNTLHGQRCNRDVDNVANVATHGPKATAVSEKEAPKGFATPQFLYITARAQLDEIAQELHGCTAAVALDIETYGQGGDALKPFRGNIRLLSLAIPGRPAWLIDLRAVGYELGSLGEVLAKKEIIGHHVKFDALWLHVKCALRLSKIFCTMTASRVLTYGTEKPNRLADCVARHLGLEMPKELARSDWSAAALTDGQLVYAANDVCHLHELRGKMDPAIDDAGLRQVATLEMAIIPVVTSMEARGINVDVEALRRLKAAAEETATQLKAQLAADLGTGVNPASNAQLLAALRGQGVMVKNTSKETLGSSQHPLAQKILAYRQALSPTKKIDELIRAVESDGRLHTEFNPVAAKTGRFSSSNPNLQNIPHGKVRECFKPPPGCVLIDADYSQVELRICAAYANEQTMLAAFRERKDLHRIMASALFGKQPEAVTSDERQSGKASNFGFAFGQGPEGFRLRAKTEYCLDLSLKQATEFRQKFFSQFRDVRRMHQKAWRKAEAGIKEVRTAFGRRILIPSDASPWDRFEAQVNYRIQGSAADGLKLAMVEINKRLPDGAYLALTVHDEVVVVAPEALAEEVKVIVETAMREALERLFPEVPFEVEAKCISNWAGK
jgi:DNA polymerase-1